MGDAPPPVPAPLAEGEGASSDPSPSRLSPDPVSVELSMAGDYYHACCGGPDPDPKPEGPQVPYVGNKVRHLDSSPALTLQPR
jgi:hypothetical protein